MVAGKFGYLQSPWGRLGVAWTENGVCCLAWESRCHCQQDVPWDGSYRGPSRLPRPLKTDLEKFFALASREDMEYPLDLGGLPPFTREVLLVTAAIPPGELLTYGEIARQLGRSGGARAVGQALGSNPVPLLVPCHRVVGKGGRLGGFSGGLETKALLLSWEGHRVDWEKGRIAPFSPG